MMNARPMLWRWKGLQKCKLLFYLEMCFVASQRVFTFLIPFLCMRRSSHEFSAMSPYGNNFIVRRRLPFYQEKRLHGNHRKLQKKVSVIVWKHCGPWRWKPERGFASKFYKLLENPMMRNKCEKFTKAVVALKKIILKAPLLLWWTDLAWRILIISNTVV